MQGTVLLVVIFEQLTVVELIESAATTNGYMSRISRVDVDAVVIQIIVAGDAVQMFLIQLPVVAVPYLNGTRTVEVGNTSVIVATCTVEAVVVENRLLEVVVFRAARLQRLDDVDILLPVAVVECRQRSGIVGLVLRLGVADFRPLHVYLYNAEAGVEIGIDTIDGQAVDRLILSHRLAVNGRDVDDIAALVHQVDVRVLVNDDEPFGLLVPGDVSNIGIVESVYLVVGSDAVVSQVILIEVVRSTHKERITSLHYLLWFGIGHIGTP